MFFYPMPVRDEPFSKYAARCFVMVGEVKVRPDRAALRMAWDAVALPLEASEEEISFWTEEHEIQKKKWAQFREFCVEDGIDPETCKRVEADGRTGVYAPDGFGWPTLVLYEGE